MGSIAMQRKKVGSAHPADLLPDFLNSKGKLQNEAE